MILTSSQSLSQLFRWLLPPLQAAQGSSVMCPLMISTPLPLLLPSSWKINTLLDFCLQAVSSLYVPSTCHVMLASFPFLPHGLGMRLMYTVRNYYISHFSWSISLTRDWLLCVWIINNHISLKKKGRPRCYAKSSHCAGCISTNSGPCKLRCGDREIGTGISRARSSQVPGLIHSFVFICCRYQFSHVHVYSFADQPNHCS